MDKHTPGPWRLRISSQEPEVMAGDFHVATCHLYAGKASCGEPSEANARLIAAAPDLYPVAKALAAMPIPDTTSDDTPLFGLDGVYITHGMIRAARRAVAKAEGRE